MNQLETCPCCRSRSIVPALEWTSRLGDHFQTDDCKDCGHRFINPQPTFDELAPYYQNDYVGYQSVEDVAPIEAATSRTLRHVTIHEGMRLMDYGCGSGSFLLQAQSLGAEVEGIEPSTYAAEVARKAGLTVHCGTVKDYPLPERGFDLITSNHVIEHVPDPIDVLHDLGKLLADDGYLWIAVPNAACPVSRRLGFRWHSADIPRHVHHFCPTSMEAAVKTAGLKVRSWGTYSLPSAVANSLKLKLKHRWHVPYRLADKLPLINSWWARRVAERLDRNKTGEALLFEIVR
jgi:2-polyprenyl-3-methyl-5-hydroxy-6-metoxy-1,4-benzoquinol methylase